MGIQRRRLSRGLDAAEPTPTSTSVAHQHNRRRSLRLVTPAPAIRDIGTPGLLADSMEVQTAQVLLQALVIARIGDRGLQPRREAGNFLLPARGSGHGCFELICLFRGQGGIVIVSGDEVRERGAGVELIGEGGLFALDVRGSGCCGGGVCCCVGAGVEGGDGERVGKGPCGGVE